MNNMIKKISIIFFIIFAILSTAFIHNVNAEEYNGSYGDGDNGFIFYEKENHVIGEYDNEYGDFVYSTLHADMRGRLIIESICQHQYNSGDYITLQELHDYYDVLCRQKGTKLPSDGDTYLVGSNGDILNAAFPNLTMNDKGMLLYKDDDRREPFGSETYTSFSLGFYRGGEIHIATPKEAYILAEMVKELEGSVFYYDILVDENGNKVKYEGSLVGAESFTIGDEEIFIVEKEYVVALPDGDLVRAEAVSDGNGGVIYRYKYGYYKNHYEKYEGSLTWEESKTGSGGIYPSFECNNSGYITGSGEVTGEVIPNGTPIYITGSNIVVKQNDEYYRATVENNNSYIQIAWWTTLAGSLGNHVNDTNFSQEADAFEAYILQAAGVTSVDQLEYVTETVIDEEGNEKEVENAFKFEYTPDWITEGEFEYPSTMFEDSTQKYLIGPFALDYVGSRVQFGGRPEVEFAGITNMEIYTDASTEPLVFGQDWEFVYLDGERTEESDPIYPKANEKFYIRLANIENATKITNIKTSFRYMNAAGSWQPLEGKYFKATWEQQRKNHYSWIQDLDEEGNVQYNEDGTIKLKQVYHHTQYWLKLTDIKEFDSQALALGVKGDKWYKYLDIDRKVDIYDGKIVIEKKLLDAQGNPIEEVDPDKFFEFKVTVNGATNSETEIVKVRAGESVESKVYYWTGEQKPTYTVEEIQSEGYELVSIENGTGELTPDGMNPVSVIATNKILKPNEGYLEVIKLMEENGLGGNNPFIGKIFNFNVTLSGTFEYAGTKYENTTITVPIEVTAAANIDSANATKVGPLTWYGDEAPTYKVEEIKQDGATLVSIIPDTGTFVNDPENAIIVTAINKQETEKGSIKIIKTLEGSSSFTREYIESLKFTFDIKVDGFEKEQITLATPSHQDENGNWVWEGVSSEYVWLYGNNPNYTITEVDVPVGTEFDGSRSQVSGTLVNDTTQDYEVINNIINIAKAPNTGKIEITKKVEEQSLVGRDYKFVVTVTGGSFKYTCPDGTVIDCANGETLQLTNNSALKLAANSEYNNENFVVINTANAGGNAGQGTWISGEFSWYGNTAPTYKVEENLLGEDIASSVEPSKGTLADSEADTVKVTAWNRNKAPKGGYIHIIKTLENADKYSIDYVKTLVFKFKIQVDGYNDTVVSLQPKRVNNTWVWEYTSDRYSWKAGEEAPNYTITEIDLPEGTEFVSAEHNGNTVTGTPSITGKIKESVSEEILITTDNTFINKLPDVKQGDLTINKKVTHESLKGQEFKFKVILKGSFEYNGATYTDEELVVYDEVNPLIVKGGEKVTIGPIKWYGTDAPTYTVQELESEIANNISIVNGSGTIEEGTGVTIATFTNEPKLVGGYLCISKHLTENKGLQDQDFYFRVTIEGYEPYIVAIKPNETYKSEMYKWYTTEPAPKYKVEEINIPEGAELVEITNAEGTLEAGSTVGTQVVAENRYEEYIGKFNVKKVVLDEKLIDAAAQQEFKMKVRVEGYFEIIGQDGIYTNGVFDISLKGGQIFTSPEIRWWGDKAPTVTVEEYDLPLGWQNVGISNNGAPITENNDLEIVVTNKLPVYVTLDLTTKLAGQVWEDEALDKDGKNTSESVPNGFIDESEKAVSGVEVYVYKVVRDSNGTEVERTLATVYKDINNTEVTLPIVTKADGTWEAPRVKIPTVTQEQKDAGYKASYDVEFVYDGQTYEPTKFLATSNGDAASFINAKTAEKDQYANNSMALDYDRDVVNNRIQIVEGNNPIDGKGNTTGKAIGNEGINNLYYESNSVTNNGNDNKKVISKLVTTDDEGKALELFKTRARTSIGGLTFPFYRDMENWNGFILYNENTSITELGLEQKYWYEAVYNYCLHINLGLVRRPDADLGLMKDLYSAKVAVKGDEEVLEYNTYRFNTLADIDADYYTRQVENQNIARYELGLYSTDYYYRAEMYQADSRLYDKVAEFYKNLGGLKSTEMDVELKYKISVYNESGTYIEVIKGINDYFDSSFGDPINVELNGNQITSYRVEQRDILGSDGVTYNKLVIDDVNVELASGEVAEFYVTFKVRKETVDGVKDTIIRGQKSNIAELSSYSTLYSDGTVAGKVDKDSAPANLNIRNYNDSAWYEDDTDAAPVLHLTVTDEGRTVNGSVWEDKAEAEAKGNGIKDDEEAVIAGLTTQLVEKVTVDGIDYEFIWPTNEALNCLGGRTMKDLTGFDSTIETARERVVTNEGAENETVEVEIGSYKFEGVPTGNYVVRFLYGNDKTQLDDTLYITQDPVALKSDGTLYSGNENILTANYDEEKEGLTPSVYNGQDYKATIYQSGFATTDANGYINNRNHDLANQSLAETRVSDARDSEARRLEIIANSETISNANANVLATANDKQADHTELYEQYYMYADTAILNLNVENASENVTHITNIDCGLIERPETALVLDKQISSIKLITNDQRVIFNADYNIVYELTNNPANRTVIAEVDGEYLVANLSLKDSSVGTDVLQSLDKYENKLAGIREANEGRQNFRFINVDDTILQGTTIEINYVITALNVGEVDYTSTTLENISSTAIANNRSTKQELLKLAREAYENNARVDSAVEVGKYLGTSYYTGNVGSDDTVVTTRVRQVIDYIDNDAIFSPIYNSDENHTWKNTNLTELAGNGYDSARLLDRTVLSEYELVDRMGRPYISEQKNNIVLSVDTADMTGSLGNSGFEAKLLPYSNNQDSYKSEIRLTITKTVSAQDDADNLTYDNIAEIVKFQNAVGRRDVLSIPGNTNPKLGEFEVSLEERDASATELITFTPPTGTQTEVTIMTQVLIVTVIALAIVAVGIVIIKKKVL